MIMGDQLRKDMDSAYQWKPEDILGGGDDAWEKLFEELNGRADELSAYCGKLGDADAALSLLKLDSELSAKLEQLYCYAHMRRDEDSANAKYQGFADRAMNLIVSYTAAFAYVQPELSALPKARLEQYIADSRFADYDCFLKRILQQKKHILSEKEERLLAQAGEVTGSFQQIFGMINNVDLPFPTVRDENGDKVKLTHATYSVFLQKKDQAVRKRAFTAYYAAFESLMNTITATYASSVKKDVFLARARGFDSCLEKALFYEEVSPKVYRNLLSSVNKGTKYLHRYMSLRKKLSGLSKLHMYDMHFPLFENEGMELDFEEAFALVKEGLKPLGEDYAELLQRSKDEQWMDVYENRGKRSGAYSTGCYNAPHPYVLLNHEKTTHGIFTIAHELGHAMHTYYSNRTQPYAKADYTIFVAEVASTVNEVLLLKHILSKTQNAELKKFLLSYYLDMFRTTLFRQTQFAEFEAVAHEMAERGEPLTEQALSQAYFDLNKKYYGRSCTYDDQIRYEWARIPHFYTSFYVYKYATGITSAVNIAHAILTEGQPAVEAYKRFLSSGGSDDPVSLLKIAGVDLMQKTPFDVAMTEFKDTLDQLTALVNA